MEEKVTDAACCADCTSFPLSFHDRQKFCRTVMGTVSFFAPACDKQGERTRSPCIEMEKLKLHQAKKELARLSNRLRLGMDKAIAAAAGKQRHDEIRADMEAYRNGEHEKFLDHEHDGVVYFVRCGSFVKIGHTKKPVNQRLNGLRTSNPFEIVLIGLCPGGVALERWFHKWLKEHHHRLEWFRMDDRFLRRIRNLIGRSGGRYFSEKVV